MQEISPSSRLHRAMRGVDRFQNRMDSAELEGIGVSALLDDGEQLLGVYRNRDPGNFVAVTTRALIFPAGGVLTRIVYDDMTSSLIEDEKSNASGIRIELRGGKVARVTIDGGEGRFRDVFSFGRFVDRVIGDRKL